MKCKSIPINLFANPCQRDATLLAQFKDPYVNVSYLMPVCDKCNVGYGVQEILGGEDFLDMFEMFES